MDLDSAIKQLQRRETQLIAELNQIRQALAELRAQKVDIKVGDLVTRGGKVYRVSKIDATDWRVWLYGNQQLKDGSFGKVARCLYDDWKRA